MTKHRLAGLAALTAVLSACEELPLQPTGLSDQLLLYAVLNPDSTRHRIEVAPTDGFTVLSLTGLTIRIHQREAASGGWTLVAEWDSARAAAAGEPFTECRYPRPSRDAEWPSLSPGPLWVNMSAGGGNYCLRPEAVLRPGATYRVEATAEGRVPAVGETRVVGDFRLEGAAISSGADAHSLTASWSESTAAHRYLMAVRRRYGQCYNCVRAWYAEVEDTSFEGRVPQAALDNAGPVPMLDVAAVDRHFHAFLTTGDQGNLHQVHPVQNVVGGYGVVGSFVHRSGEIAMNR